MKQQQIVAIPSSGRIKIQKKKNKSCSIGTKLCSNQQYLSGESARSIVWPRQKTCNQICVPELCPLPKHIIITAMSAAAKKAAQVTHITHTHTQLANLTSKLCTRNRVNEIKHCSLSITGGLQKAEREEDRRTAGP